VVMALSNVGRQLRGSARNALLWEVVEYLEREAPDTDMDWVYVPSIGSASDELPFSEGGHFFCHLLQRGRTGTLMAFLPREVPAVSSPLALTGTLQAPGEGDYYLLREFRTDYWAGLRSFRCYLWASREPDPALTVLHEE